MKHSSRSIFRSTRQLTTAASFAALLLSVTPAARAATKTYYGPNNGLWSTAANWSPSGAPGQSDNVFLGTHSPGAGTTDLNVTFNIASPSLVSLTLDATALSGYMILNQNTLNSVMDATTLNVGVSASNNRYNQSFGTAGFAFFNMGVNASSKNNFYTLTGGSVTANYAKIGVSGSATFNQGGGTCQGYQIDQYSALPSITLGVNAGGSGTYNLSGGSLDTSDVFVGKAGSGLFNQTSGTSNANFTVGSTGGAATCNLSGGTLTGLVTLNQGGTFNLQAGGTANVGQVNFVGGGTFNLSGGSFNGTPMFTFQDGGTLIVGVNNFSVKTLEGNGTVQSGGSSTSILTLSPDTRPGSQTGLYEFSGSLRDGDSGRLGLTFAGASYKGDQVLSGNNTYTGPTMVLSSTLHAGSNTAFSAASAYTLNGGNLDTGGFNVTLGSLSGSGAVLIGTGSVREGDGTSTSYSGQLTGSGAFTKIGSGALTLSGGGTSYTGHFDVQSGALTVGAVNGIPTASTVSLGLGATLNVNFDQTLASLNAGTLNTTAFANNSTLTIGGDNADMSHGAQFTGAGKLVKNGTGTLTFGNGAADFVANTDTGLGIVVNAGQLTLAKSTGTTAVAGALTINGGSVVLNASSLIADTSLVTLGGGTLNLAGNAETIGGLAGSTGTVQFGGGSLTVAASTSRTFGGTFVGPGTFIKTGTADLTLTNTGNYGGTFSVRRGRLTLQGAVNATGLTAQNTGILRLDGNNLELNNRSIQADTGGTVEYLGTTINNGFLRGSGSHTILAGNTSTFNGVTTYNSTVITQNGSAAFTNFTNGGTLNNNVAATFSGGENKSSGVVNVNSTLDTQDFTNNGVVNVNNGGTINNTASNLFAGGGSRTYIASGGALNTASGTSIELNGALLVNNGTQTGVLNVNYGSTAKGAGTFGTVNVTDGGHFGVNATTSGTTNATSAVSHRFNAASLVSLDQGLSASPATVTVGSLTLGSNSFFAFDLQDTQGAAGSGYDLVHASGLLTLAAGTQAGERIVISLTSLGADGSNGLAANFNPMQSYQFTMIHADGGVTGYNPAEFAVDTSGFQNALQGGSFSVQQSGNDLVLAYQASAVPEPGTWASIALGSVMLALATNRRRRC